MSRQSVLPCLLLAALVGRTSLAETPTWPLNQPFMPHRARLGVQIQPMTTELREYFQAPPDRGLLVTLVAPQGPGARAGLHVGDVIVTAAGQPMRRPFDLVKVVGRVPRGQSLELRVIRDSHERTLTAEPEGEAAPWVDPDYWAEWLGKGLQQGTESLHRQLDDIERRLQELERKFEQQHPADEKHAT